MSNHQLFPDVVRLMQVLPAPSAQDSTRALTDWATAEREVGLSLPDDYKDFIDAYGFGLIGDIFVLDPFSADPLLNLASVADMLLGVLRENRTAGLCVPGPLFPEPGGIYPWGATGNGDYGFWVTSPRQEPNSWSVLWTRRQGGDMATYDGSMSRFLADLIEGRLVVPFLTGLLPSPPTFSPYPPRL